LTSKFNVSPTQIMAKGVGPLAPIANNDSEDGRRLNRRVEMVKQ
jgi:outer membrane protein OmpA-like peptidoglycan-associated protein